VERSLEEQMYFGNFYSLIERQQPSSAKKPLGLIFGTLNHGHQLQIPGRGYSFVVDLRSDTGYRTSEHLLTQDFELPGFERRISAIYGSFGRILLLMRYLSERGVQLPSGQIRVVQTFGQFVPAAQRAVAERYFGVRIDTSYSMTEVFCGARYGHEENAYFFDPMGVAELVDAQGCPVREGEVGELVVTPLFPFCQHFVVLRYRTGDLFVARSTDSPRGRRALVFKGRKANSIEIEGVGVLGSADVAEVLESIPEVYRPNLPHIKAVSDTAFAGLPKFVLSLQAQERIRLQVAIREGAIRNNAQQNEREESIRRGLMAVADSKVAAWLSERMSRLCVEWISPRELPAERGWDV
jgi:phenylacetate-coenzyme A ligase PaaK-like adenylate-forming protein